ncbi:MAG: indole-3-glycerol-phosphate synthase [Desulfovibrionaceae bacterium]|nr:indole-3-glycerol-phosphate synthase [Desulfovibrionaceae bacterium]
MLERFRAAKQAEIADLARLASAGRMPAPLPGKRPSFCTALTRAEGIAVIAEYKRASPSKGVINLELTPGDVARAYARAGADCLSVLTEADHFQGDLEFLDRMRPTGLPMLRKDFLLDPLQVRRTAATPASALLLIARMFDDADGLATLLELAASFGIESVVEIFDRRDLTLARRAGARIIQVNNRDLDTLETSLDVSLSLIVERRPSELWISASGVTRPEDLVLLREAGFGAALVGTFLMQGGDPEAALKHLLGAVRPPADTIPGATR